MENVETINGNCFEHTAYLKRFYAPKLKYVDKFIFGGWLPYDCVFETNCKRILEMKQKQQRVYKRYHTAKNK